VSIGFSSWSQKKTPPGTVRTGSIEKLVVFEISASDRSRPSGAVIRIDRSGERGAGSAWIAQLVHAVRHHVLESAGSAPALSTGPFCPRSDEQALTRDIRRISYGLEMTAEIRILRKNGMWWRWPSASPLARPAIV